MSVKNAGKYDKKINIIKVDITKDSAGFPKETDVTILSPYACVKTTKGYTLIKNDTDFEKSYTNFTIRYSKKVEDEYNSLLTDRKLYVEYKNKRYTVEYLNNVDEEDVELEMQCKLVRK